jgi:hypothetical protein
MTKDKEKKIFDLEDESGGVYIVATQGGFQAYAKTNVEHVGNSHVLLLVRGIMEILQTNPLVLYEAGQGALQKELLESGIDLNEMQKMPEEALEKKDNIDYTNVISLANVKIKGNA